MELSFVDLSLKVPQCKKVPFLLCPLATSIMEACCHLRWAPSGEKDGVKGYRQKLELGSTCWHHGSLSA